MKKLIVAAMMVLGTTSAFAGDSDALKAVLKAKTYAEAEALVKQNLGQLADNAEKAKAYNKLVDLGMKAFNDQQSIQQTNQIMKKNDPVDENAMNEGAYNALMNAIECYKYDQLPNAKGKVAPKFKGNASRVWGARQQLVNAGQAAAQNNKADEVLKYWGAFLDTDSDPLFASIDAKQKDAEKDYIGQVALFAARYAYQAKDAARCEKYCDIAMTSEKEAKDALNLKLYVMKDGLKTKADSLAYVDKLKALFDKDQTNDVILDGLNSMYSSMKMEKEQMELLDGAIAKNPKLLLCDEPTGALDYQTGKSILGLLRSMCDNYGMTVIVITHNSALAPMADQVIHLKNGKVEKQEYNEHPESIDNIEW